MTMFPRILTGAALLLLVAGPALAVGPVDLEVGAVWWQSETEIESGSMSETYDSEAPGAHAQLWVGNWGVNADWFETSIDEGGVDVDGTWFNVDVRRQWAFTENNYFAVGVGWQMIDYDEWDTSGLRVSAEGRVGLFGLVMGYAEAGFYPELDDIEDGDMVGEDVMGYDVEVGVMIHPAPFLRLRAGYRMSSLEFDYRFAGSPALMQEADPETSLSPDGFLVGVGFKF
jgi:hypothetical protein